MGNVQVGNGDGTEVLLAQIGNESGEVGESFAIDGEGAILELVVDVEVEDIGRYRVGAKTLGNLPHLRFRSVAVARLLEAKSPQRRQRGRSGEIGIALYHLFRRWAIEHVVVKRATFGAEENGVPRLFAEVKPGAPGVVEEKSITAGVVNGQEKGNALIKWVDRFLRTDVGVPERVGLIPAVKRSCLVAQSEKMLVAWHLLGNGETSELECYGAADGVGGNDVAREVANNEAKRTALDTDIERGGAEAYGGGVLGRLNIDGLAAWSR